MTGFIIFLLLVAVVVLAVLLLRSRSKPAAPVPVDPLRRDSRGIDPRKLKVGDVVHLDARDWLIRGSLAFDQDGFQWHEHLLDDANLRRWLSVEDDEELEVVVWSAIDGIADEPGAPTMTLEGRTYRLEERGRASFTATGTTGTAASGFMEYCDYADGDHRLSFERYGTGSWEAGLGVVVNERSLDIYPSSPA